MPALPLCSLAAVARLLASWAAGPNWCLPPCSAQPPAPTCRRFLFASLRIDTGWDLRICGQGQRCRHTVERRSGAGQTSSAGQWPAQKSRHAAAAPTAPTLPRQASLNWVPLPQPRGHGNPIFRFLRQLQSAKGRDQRRGARNRDCSRPGHPAHRWQPTDFKNFSKQWVW